MLSILEKRKILLIYVPLAVYWVILLFLTSIPGPDIPQSISFNDKLEHISAFCILGVLLMLALKVQNRFPALKLHYWLFALFISSFYGALDEVHQLFIVGRSCDFLDWIADTGGALVGVLCMGLLIYFDERSETRIV